MGFTVYPGKPRDVKLRYVGCVTPLKVSPKEHFPPIRRFLQESGYTESAVCQRLGIADMDGCITHAAFRTQHSAHDRLDILLRLFLTGEFLDRKELEAWFPPEVLDAATTLGLIMPSPDQPGMWISTAALYPSFGLHIASDRWRTPVDRGRDLEANPQPVVSSSHEVAMDWVFPAISEATRQFMETLPDDPCEHFLDLGSGTGVAALAAASRYAGRAWSADITDAAAHYAEFNRLLNDLDNVSVVKGDLYEPVNGLTFDRIAANPPYMPSLRRAAVFAYGGELGDQTTQRIVASLPKYLRPGGRFYCTTAGPDRVPESFEFRVRSWLEEAGPEFDVVAIERNGFNPAFISHQQAAISRGGTEQVAEWKQLFDKHQVEQFFYGSLVVQRKKSPGRPVTARRKKGSRLGTAEIEWLRRWETAAGGSDMPQRILDARLKIVPGMELNVTHRLADAEFAPQEFRLQTTYPFTTECAVQRWVAYFLPRCDGKTPARDVLGWLKENQLVDASAPEGEFADYLRVLISGGFLEMDEFPLPAR